MTSLLSSLKPTSALLLAVALASMLGCSGSEEEPASAANSPAEQGSGVEPNEQVKVLGRALDPALPPEMRVFAVQQLAVIGTPDTVPLITKAMSDEDERVVLAAVEGLPDTTDANALAELEDRAANGSEEVSQAAKRRLSDLEQR